MTAPWAAPNPYRTWGSYDPAPGIVNAFWYLFYLYNGILYRNFFAVRQEVRLVIPGPP